MVSSWTCLPRSCATEVDCEIAIEPESNVSCANPVILGRLHPVRLAHPRDQEGPLPTSFAARIPRAGFIRATTVFAVGTLLLGGLAPTASADDGLEVTTAYPAVAVAPGSKVSFDLKVTSTRAGDVALERGFGADGLDRNTSRRRVRRRWCQCRSRYRRHGPPRHLCPGRRDRLDPDAPRQRLARQHARRPADLASASTRGLPATSRSRRTRRPSRVRRTAVSRSP